MVLGVLGQRLQVTVSLLGGEHQILSTTTHIGQRKIATESELVAPDGSSLAVASGIWVKPPLLDRVAT
jgi:hypothetical protein